METYRAMEEKDAAADLVLFRDIRHDFRHITKGRR